MLKKIRSVIYYVQDLSAAKHWYQNFLGIAPYFDQPFYVGFSFNGCELGLDPDVKNASTGNHSYALWSVDDIEQTCQKVLAIGGSIVSAKQNVGEGIWVAKVADCWGNHIGIIQED
jgi:predicted enzyme related to lactoylglutathione lyase